MPNYLRKTTCDVIQEVDFHQNNYLRFVKLYPCVLCVNQFIHSCELLGKVSIADLRELSLVLLLKINYLDTRMRHLTSSKVSKDFQC